MNKETALNIDQRSIKISDFVSARATEINSFTTTLKTKLASLNKLPFQLLPKHMRRRAMSHNKYRIPTRVRNKIKEEELLLKKPSTSRKHLRNARLLLSSYARRYKSSKWLETHLWHAKRMKMKDYFGYTIAETCRAKSSRAAYKYFKTDCLLYDLSYNFIFELKAASKERIIDFLSPFVDLSSKEWNSFCKNKDINQGSKKGYICLWNNNPQKLIQRCEYIIRPREAENSSFQVWFFLHPSSKESLDHILRDGNVNTDGITYKIYEANFNIFHLIGPTSCNRLYWLLQNIAGSKEELALLKESPLIKAMPVIEDPGVYPRNFVLHLSLEKRKEAKLLNAPKTIIKHQEQSSLEEQENINNFVIELASYKNTPSKEAANLELWNAPEIPPEDEHSLRFKTITRGRFTHRKKDYLNNLEEERKKKAQNAKNKSKKSKESAPPKTEIEEPALVEHQVDPNLKAMVEEIMTSQPGNKPQATGDMEEEKFPVEPEKKRIELIIMQDEGESQTCQGAGIKIVVPCGNGLFVWRYLNYLGCKALGLQEYLQVLNERRDFVFPNDFPYSKGYEKYRDNLKQEKILKYFKKPPAKRINLAKIVSPYAFASEWETASAQHSTILNPNINIELSLKDFLVPVYIRMVRKRYPVDQAMLCLPTIEELALIKKSEQKSESGPDSVHTEPIGKCSFDKPLKKVTQEEYMEKLREMQPSRKLGGFITTGYLSYRFGTGCGKGHIFKPILSELKPFEVLKSTTRDSFENSLSYNASFYMLVKNPSSRYYYACKVYLLDA